MSKWKKIKDERPKGHGPYLYFPVKLVCGHSVQVSNGDYLRGEYVPLTVDGIDTVWCEIDFPEQYDQFEKTRDEWEDVDPDYSRLKVYED